MFTDMVGFSVAAQVDESGALQRLGEQSELVRPVIDLYHGRRIKSTGDGLLVEFDSALRATECALEIQRRLRDRSARLGAIPIELRIGIHLGDVEEEGEDILGDAVNIAARVEPQADPGGVCISQQVYDQVRGKLPLSFEKLPARELKNLRVSIDLYRVVLPWIPAAPIALSEGLPRLAVLPFANFSPEASDAYFADGLTEELITFLSQLRGIRVIARTSVFAYKSTAKSVAQIGSELGVSSVLEGSVRKSGDRIRITVQLIETRSQEHIWSETFDRRLDDIFAVQTALAREVARTLKVRMTYSETAKTSTRAPPRPESYLAYLKGRTALQGQFGGETFRAARKEFELAIQLDPTNARALSGLADSLELLASGHYVENQTETIRLAREFATRAVELDPDLAEAHSSLGALLWWEYDYRGAEAELLRAISLNSNYAVPHGVYAYILMEMGRGADAVRETEIEEILDPRSMRMYDHRVHLLVWLGRMEEASSVCDRLGQIAPDSITYHICHAWLCLGQGDLQGSLEHLKRAEVLDPEPWTQVPQAWLQALMGNKELARQLLTQARLSLKTYFGPWGYALGFALIGDLDEAFRILFEAAEKHDLTVGIFRLWPLLEPVRSDVRFGELLGRLNLN